MDMETNNRQYNTVIYIQHVDSVWDVENFIDFFCSFSPVKTGLAVMSLSEYRDKSIVHIYICTQHNHMRIILYIHVCTYVFMPACMFCQHNNSSE